MWAMAGSLHQGCEGRQAMGGLQQRGVCIAGTASASCGIAGCAG